MFVRDDRNQRAYSISCIEEIYKDVEIYGRGERDLAPRWVKPRDTVDPYFYVMRRLYLIKVKMKDGTIFTVWEGTSVEERHKVFIEMSLGNFERQSIDVDLIQEMPPTTLTPKHLVPKESYDLDMKEVEG